MLQKNQLTTFVEKYYLSGSVEAAIISAKDKKISTKFMLPSKDLLGRIELNDFDIEESEIGVYYTGVLLKMLSILDNDIDIVLKKGNGEANDKIVTLKITDKKGKHIDYATCDLELIEKTDKKSKDLNYDIKIELNNELIDDILKATSSIDTNSITFFSKREKLYVVFGYSKNNTNQIKFEVNATLPEDEVEVISFNVINLKNILVANKKFDTGTIEISPKGLMKVYFTSENSTSEYFLVKLQESNE